MEAQRGECEWQSSDITWQGHMNLIPELEGD